MKVVVVAAAAAAIVVAAVILVGVLVGISNYSCKNIYFLSGYFWISPSFGCCSLRHSCHLTPGNCSEIRTEQEYINIKRNFNNSSYPESVTSASVGGKTRATVKDQKIATACVPNDKGLSKNIKICRPHDALIHEYGHIVSMSSIPQMDSMYSMEMGRSIGEHY